MQERRLVRVPDLAAFQEALVARSLDGPPIAARRRLVIVPTRASAELLRQTIERTALTTERRAIILPDFVTREGFIARLHDAVPDGPPLLTRLEREVLLERGAVRAARRARMPGHPFEIRPGLVSQMLDLYDELGRRQRSVRRFARSLFDQLRVERGTDRGSEGLIHQTCFLAFAFLAYRRGVQAAGGADEHVLRRLLLARQPALSFDHVVVALADHPADPRGLWPADFDLIGRLVHLRRIDVVVTDETHDAGFRARIERELPGIEEERAGAAAAAPVLVRPSGAAEDALSWTSRDREEELADVVRMVRARTDASADRRLQPTAIVFERPLPYLYLAGRIFDEARVPFQAFDALPLAAEPQAALLDLVLAVARTGATREAAVELLRSPLLEIDVDGERVEAADAAALEAVLADRRTAGEADTFASEVAACMAMRRSGPRRADRDRAVRAARAAAAVREALGPFRAGPTASAQVGAVAGFLRRHQRAPSADAPWRDRHFRARAAVLAVLDGLADALRRHSNAVRSTEAITALIHHAIEAETFTPDLGREGVHLVDAVAARFGRFDHVHLVGLVDTEWSDRPRRSIFYTTELLDVIGWPHPGDQTRARHAAFRDLLRLPRQALYLHAFRFESDAIVAVSPMTDAAHDIPSRQAEPAPRPSLFQDERLTGPQPAISGLDASTAEWLSLRRRRPPVDAPAYRGVVAPQAPRAYRVSRVERYVVCPFKYFAESVLSLPEEREEEAGLSPAERGSLLHDLFERFYRTWHLAGRGAITPDTVPAAVALFDRLAREVLAALPKPDRALEEARLLGSMVAQGVAERVFEHEAEAGGRIVDRLIEFELNGPVTFPRLSGLASRVIEMRGKADRIDVFDDGSLRVIDYKLGRPPDDDSLQVGVYAHATAALLQAKDGRPHSIRAAAYLAFRGDRALETALGSKAQPVEMAVQSKASDFAGIVERIEGGEFPPRPKTPSECQRCRYAGVCRKEYRTERDVATELARSG